jgi:hypothetical protein
LTYINAELIKPEEVKNSMRHDISTVAEFENKKRRTLAAEGKLVG